MNFAEITSLVDVGSDTFEGRGPEYRGGVLFGGQAMAHGLVAAGRTVEPPFAVDSMHAHFLRPGDGREPTRLEVARLRDGRTFATRSVVARQSRGVILEMTVTFQSLSAAPFRSSCAAPDVPEPDALDDSSWSSVFDRRLVSEDDGRTVVWLRMAGDDSDDALRAAAALLFLSDGQPIGCVRSQRAVDDGPSADQWDGISLDHTVWFHHPAKAGGWQLHEFQCEGLGLPRGLVRGHVWAPDGTLLATVAQELLLVRRS